MIILKDSIKQYKNKPALYNVNLHIEPGEFVAILGESGIGKTTLIRLLMAFLEGESGNIEFFNSRGQKIKKPRKRHKHRLIKKSANLNGKSGKWPKSMKKRNKYALYP